MQAVVPTQGPCWCVGSSCQIEILYCRIRKTGIPWGSVAVACCKAHGVSFTLYPPGCVPYGRESWVELGPDGNALEQGEGEEACLASSGYFAAVQDAADGKRWPVDSAPTPPDAVRTTQRRRLARAAAILGLEEDLEPEAEAVAEVTHLPAGDLLGVLDRLARTCDLVGRGREIWNVFAEVTGAAGHALMDRLAVLGHLAGLWGQPSARAASSVPLPATTTPSGVTTIGFCWPRRRSESAIAWTLRSLWARAFAGSRVRSATGRRRGSRPAACCTSDAVAFQRVDMPVF